jgi:hypothetical protein
VDAQAFAVYVFPSTRTRMRTYLYKFAFATFYTQNDTDNPASLVIQGKRFTGDDLVQCVMADTNLWSELVDARFVIVAHPLAPRNHTHIQRPPIMQYAVGQRVDHPWLNAFARGPGGNPLVVHRRQMFPQKLALPRDGYTHFLRVSTILVA